MLLTQRVGLYFPAMNGVVPRSEEDVQAACGRALRLAPAEYPPTPPKSNELLGEPEWYPFEHEAWAIGESIRRAFVQHPQLKKNTALVSKVAEVATRRNLRRGRQSFIMAIGFVAACPHASSLLASVNDPDVNGQIIHTLLKMRAGAFAQAVAPFGSVGQGLDKALGKEIHRTLSEH